MQSIKTLSTVFVLTLLLSFISIGNASAADTVWKLTHNAAQGQAIDLATLRFAELVQEGTGGRLEIQVFGNNILGPDHSTREMVVEGSIQMVSMGGPFLTNYNKQIDLMSMLFNFTDREEMMSVFTGAWGEKWLVQPFLKNQGIRLIDQWPQSNRLLISKKPVRTMADLSGLKIRVPAGLPLWEDAWTTLGAMALSLALEDAFTGMQQGVVDAVEMPADFIYNNRFMEAAKFLTLTNHALYTQFLIVNEAAFQALSPEDQKVVLDAAKKAGIYSTELLDQTDAKLIKDMVDNFGVEVIELSADERQKFIKAIEPLYTKYMANWGEECYADYTAAIEAYKSSH